MKKALFLLGLLLLANGMSHLLLGQNDEEPIALEYQDYKFFDDEPSYKLMEYYVDWVGYANCESTQKFYIVDRQQKVTEYDMKNALTEPIKRRMFDLPFKVENNAMEISPNGQFLAFVEESGENLHIVDVSSGEVVASCKMGEEYVNKIDNNTDVGHPFVFLSNNEVLVTGTKKAIIYNIKDDNSTVLAFDKKYSAVPKTTVTSKGTISGWYKTDSNKKVWITLFIESGRIQNVIEDLYIFENPNYYRYQYYRNEHVEYEYYDKLTGNKVDSNTPFLNDGKCYYYSYNKEKKCGSIRFFNLQGNASKYSAQQQETLKKYALCFKKEDGYYDRWIQDGQILPLLSRSNKRLIFFNHTLTGNEIAKQALLSAINTNTIEAYDQFIADFKDSRYVEIAQQKKTALESTVMDLTPFQVSNDNEPLSPSNKSKVYKSLPGVGPVAGEFYVGKFTGVPIPRQPAITNRDLTMYWELDFNHGVVACLTPYPKGGGSSTIKNEAIVITLTNGTRITWKYDSGQTSRGWVSLTIPFLDFKQEKISISSINIPEQTGKTDWNDYYTVYNDHVHMVDYTFPFNVSDVKAYYYFYQAKRASLEDAITYAKDCTKGNYRSMIENVIVSEKANSFSDIVYCNDNYPKLSDRLEGKMFGFIGSMADCNSYLKYYSTNKRGADMDEKVYQYVSPSNDISDCETYLKNFPNGKHKAEVTAQKNEIASYNAAQKGGKAECIAYLTKYPKGRFASEIQNKKEGIVKDEQRTAQLKVYSDKKNWKLGDKMCNCTSDGIIMATLDQWNEDRSSFKGIISASPGGLFQGDLLSKGNALWFKTSGWHKCLDDEIDYALSHDKSLEAEQLLKAKKMRFTRGSIVSHTYYSKGWFSRTSHRVTARVDDWNEDFTRMKIQIISTGGLDYINGESVYEGKHLWVSPIDWQ